VRKYRARKATTLPPQIASPIPLQSPPPMAPISLEQREQQLDKELQLDYKSWPRWRMFMDKPCARRFSILQSAYRAMQ